MSTKTVFQSDDQGWFSGASTAFESPLEPGVFLIPAGAVEVSPPESWPGDVWPRLLNGEWVLQSPPAPVAKSAVQRLREYLVGLLQGGV